MQESKLTNFQQRQLSANMKGAYVCVWIPSRVFRQSRDWLMKIRGDNQIENEARA